MLETLLDRFQQAASALPDPRTGSNKRYDVSDAAACALATFFVQSPSFLDFQRRMQEESARSNCDSLFGVSKIPSDNSIRNLLDALDPALFAELFPLCLDTVRDHG
ncbi:MAG: transposase family protein, partial [Bryobacterales bacterium]|nr:transposase family protein [Bryobacterales bacterium]